MTYDFPIADTLDRAERFKRGGWEPRTIAQPFSRRIATRYRLSSTPAKAP